MHNWILEGLPLEIRVQHIKYLESEQQSQKNLVKSIRKPDVKILIILDQQIYSRRLGSIA